MKDGTRFELKLSTAQRALLDELSTQTGMSISDLVRLGVHLVTRDKLPAVGPANATVEGLIKVVGDLPKRAAGA